MTDYAQKVVKGRIPVGKYQRLSCQRHLNDKKRSRTKAFPYKYVPALADSAFRFYSKLRHYKCGWQGRPFTLLEWQVFCTGSIFGWVDKKTGLRRFVRTYIEVPKKSGKTMWAAGTGLKQGFFDGEAGAEVYSIATMRDQAKLVWDDAAQMVEQSPDLKRRIEQLSGVSVLRRKGSSACKFQPIGRDRDSADGKNPSCLIVDELHRHKDDALINVLTDSMVARDQPLVIEITTAGIRNETTAGWKHHKYATEILDGIIENEERFVFIAGADEEDIEHWQDEAVWIKANPSWGFSVTPKGIRQNAKEATAIATKRNDFLRYHLNIWVEQHSVWIPAERWASCRPRRSIELLRGEKCFGGLDMAQTEDFASLELTFRDPDAEQETYDVISYFWLPEATLQARIEKSKIRFDLWRDKGYLEVTPGKRINRKYIVKKILDLLVIYDLSQIWYDPSNATQLVIDVEEAIGNSEFMVEHFQQARKMHEPLSKLADLVAERNLRHGENPILRWMNNNVTIRTDSEGRIKIDKEKSSEKVDGMVALAMSLNGWINYQRQPPETSVYTEERGVEVW